MIRLQNIEKVYRTDTVETLAINRINLDIAKGEFLSIMGPSGCGKSTLLNIMGLLDEPSKGNITIDSQDTSHFSDKKLANFRNEKLGFIFQSYHLINDLQVLDNVELPLLYRTSSAKERKELATAALEKVGLSNRLKHFPGQLSGGQRQRVAIARAIVGQPQIILADEPTGNLDPDTSEEIVMLLRQISLGGTSVLMATHDYHIIRTFPSRIIKCEGGIVHEDAQIV